MTDFTDSPYERPMKEDARDHPDVTPQPKPGHPCFGCGNFTSGCVWPCWKPLSQQHSSRGEPQQPASVS